MDRENNTRTFKNYTKEQIDQFLDQVIKQVERMIEDNKTKSKEIALKDSQIEELTKKLEGMSRVQDRLSQYERMEDTLNKAVVMAQRNSEQIKASAHRESEMILDEARRNASRIVNESLLKAERTEMEADALKRNINVFKRKLRGIIEAQLEMVDDIEKVDF